MRPFVVRTEKRLSIDAEGKPLFKPRMTRTQAVAWLERHSAQKDLYEAITEYVRHGYNQAMASKQRHIGFLMILMQRLVTSSTAAIRATLEKRLLALDDDQHQLQLFSTEGVGDWHELTGDDQIDIAVAFDALEDERKDVEALLFLARETEAQGTDGKPRRSLSRFTRSSRRKTTLNSRFWFSPSLFQPSLC